MKYLRLALLLLASSLGLVRAQSEDEQNRPPPTEIPDFSNLDEYVYEPKSTLMLSMRHLSGAKVQFFGTGVLGAPEAPTDATTPNIQRTYHDGSVSPDARVAGRVDANGNPVIDSLTGNQVFDPVANDGKTNTWSYTDPSQITIDNYMAFHTYSADITDPITHSLKANGANGVDVAVSRDMGKIFGTRATWSLIAGVSFNDLDAEKVATVQATITTITDLYALDGQVVPPAPYSAPSTASTSVTDALGNIVVNSDGTTQTATTDTTVLLSNAPIARQVSTQTDSVTVTDLWKLHGAALTFRAGPAIWVPVTARFRATLSAGPALVYAGSTYSVTQSFQPTLGAEITDTESSTEKHALPGYFADASLQFDLTDHAGFFAGFVYQSAGSYTQTLDTASTTTATADHYSTKVDFSGQNGLRAGMTIRF